MTVARTRLLLLALPLLSLTEIGRPARPLEGPDAYIWQRQWTPALAAAIDQSADLVRAWRVLAAESDARGHLQPVTLDWTTLGRSGRPVILVVRIDGQLTQWDETGLLAELGGLLTHEHPGPATIAGVEIDHDCGTARLAAYAQFLAQVRARLGNALPLSITALPAWLSSPDLDAVLAQADEVVLQVHAVQNPRAGLLDRARAVRWTVAMARRTHKPFRVALPTYGSKVSWGDDGAILAVESEVPLLAGSRTTREMLASPVEVSALLGELERHPPDHFTGVAWFRLPTDDDRRAWSLATWRAVVRRQPLHARIETEARYSETPGRRNLLLINRGEIDAELPERVELPRACTVADGINGYGLQHESAGLSLRRLQVGLLRGHHQQLIGWMRCAADPAVMHDE